MLWQHGEPLNDCLCSVVVKVVCKLEIAYYLTFS